MVKRGKDIRKLETIMSRILHDERLEPQQKDHKLHGKFSGRRECHIESDWLLIYKLEREEVTFERTGTHADIFNL